MDFYQLDKAKYKKYSKEFRNTTVGGRISLFYKVFTILALLDLWLSFVKIIIEDITNKPVNDMNEIINSISDVSLAICVLIAVISYFVYLKHLKNYVETRNNK